MEPASTEAYFNKALLYAERGDYKNAIASYDKVIQLNETDAEAQTQRGLAKIKLKMQAAGCADIRRGDELGDPEAKGYLKAFCK